MIFQDKVASVGDHAICQDYVYQFQEGDRYWGLLSDGCSSSPETYVGARILVHAATSVLNDLHPLDLSYLELEQFAQATALKTCSLLRELHLPLEAADATLWFYCVDGNKVHVFSTGDGCLITCCKNQETETLWMRHIVYATEEKEESYPYPDIIGVPYPCT